MQFSLVRRAATSGIKAKASGEGCRGGGNEGHHGSNLMQLSCALHGDLVSHVLDLWWSGVSVSVCSCHTMTVGV